MCVRNVLYYVLVTLFLQIDYGILIKSISTEFVMIYYSTDVHLHYHRILLYCIHVSPYQAIISVHSCIIKEPILLALFGYLLKV
jgi:hypothetical protein